MSPLVPRILAGDLRALARAATLIENRRPEAVEILKALFPQTGRAEIFGITGSPGAGKSTLTNAITRELRRQQRTVGIIAVDPTSPYSGGAILGDRIRMLDHHDDSGVFIRSMATRGRLGGLAPATSDMVLLFDGAARDTVLIETVGVGQDEIDIARLASVTAVVLVPGMGDDVQAIKAGIMEIADVFIINKADLPGADRLERELQAALSLSERPGGWVPPIVRTVARDNIGVADVLIAMRQCAASGLPQQRAAANWRVRLAELMRERLLARLPQADVEAAAERVAVRTLDPFTAVEELLEKLS